MKKTAHLCFGTESLSAIKILFLETN